MPKKNVIKKSALSPTVLIAGGAGFIGSHLADVFLANGARVVVLDDFRSGKDIYVKELLTNQNFALFDVDINTDFPEQIESVDYVIHLAGLEEYLFSKEAINLNALLTNSVGTKNLLDFALKAKAKFLLVSSTDVYQGRMSQIELKEYFGKTNMDENKYMLTEAKRYAEALVWEYYKKNDMDVRIVRLPEVYGPRMNLEASGSLGSLMKDLIEGRNITVYGDGDSKAYYLYVNDVVSGVVKALFNPGTKGSIYSLIVGDPIADVELAYLVKSLADRELQVEFKPVPEGVDKKPFANKPDTFNLAELEWQPKVTVKDGVFHTLQWFGYHPNEFSFKPGKLIVEKKKDSEKVELRPVQDMIFSLQGLKDENVPTQITTEKIPVKNTFFKDKIRGLFKRKAKEEKQTIAAPVVERKPLVNPSSPIGKFFTFTRAHSMVIAALFASVFAALLIFLVTPLAITYLDIKNGQAALEKTIKMGSTLDSEGVRISARDAYKDFYNAKKMFSSTKWAFYVSGKKNLFDSSSKTLGSAVYFSKAAYTLADAVKPFESLWEVIRPDTAQELDTKVYDDAKLQVLSAKNDIQLAQADLNYVNINDLPNKIQPKVTAYRNGLAELAGALDLADPILSYLPDTLGAQSPKKYLLLFQNNNEVRPTGGFIGSYGILSFEKGKIKSLDIDDIYNPDGQIDLRNINVPAPKQFDTYLGEKKLHLRNANWDPDFPTTANTIKDLYFKVTGDQLDGVLAVDLSFVQNLLKATGPVFLTAYNEEITADNLYERTQFHSDYNYTDGSDQKKSFLTVLGSKLLERIFSTNKENISSLMNSMYASLNERHFLISFSNNPINVVLADKHWDGSIVKTDGDYLNIVNANLGGTKANYFVHSNYSYNVSSQTRDGLLRATVTLNYTHTGKDNAWPGGPYTDYVRVLTQKGVRLTGATAKFSTSDKADDIMKQIDVSNELSYNTFGFGFKLDPGSSLTLSISYDLPVNLSITKDFKNYTLVWQKQSGENNTPEEFIFNKPFGLQLSSSTPGFVFDQDAIKYERDASNDQYFYVKLQ